MRTLDDEANALRDVREHVAAAIKALPPSADDIPRLSEHWSRIDYGLDKLRERIDRALKEIGA